MTKTNAYILSSTMNEYELLLAELKQASFDFTKEADREDVRAYVPFARKEEFANIIQPHLSAPFNYVDVKHPEENQIYAIFGTKRIIITSKAENDAAKKWAIDLGLPPAQAEWSHWFE
ncbi:MAG: hypothetical protein AAB657_03605 [Patescibacteria group bacterium]